MHIPRKTQGFEFPSRIKKVWFISFIERYKKKQGEQQLLFCWSNSDLQQGTQVPLRDDMAPGAPETRHFAFLADRLPVNLAIFDANRPQVEGIWLKSTPEKRSHDHRLIHGGLFQPVMVVFGGGWSPSKCQKFVELLGFGGDWWKVENVHIGGLPNQKMCINFTKKNTYHKS